MSDRDPLQDDLDRLRREKRWTPLTPEEADTELAATPDEPLDENRIDALIDSALTGEVTHAPTKPEHPRTTEERLEHDRHALLFNRTPDDDDGAHDEHLPESPPGETQGEGDDDPDEGGHSPSPRG